MVTDDFAMQLATFRFGVIADFVTGTRLSRGEKLRLLDEKAKRSYQIPGTSRTRISKSTMYLWIANYKKAGYRIEGLMPQKRKDSGSYRKLDPSIRMAIRELRQENPHYTVPVMITKLKHERLIGADERLNKSSIYRFLKHEKSHNGTAVTPSDKRRFEAAYPNEIWQCDVMHGPMVKVKEGPHKKAYLLAIMDDHTRLIVHAQFYLNETFESLKDCLRQAVSRRGIPSKFYVDNGACYRSTQLEQVLAALGAALTHSKPYTPEGRGKIERWFRYVRQDFLPIHAHKPLSLQELNNQLESWLDSYNDKPHSTTKMSPYERYRKNLSCIRPAPEDLLDYFRRVEIRRVKKDRTVQVNNRHFEVPTGLIDRRVELRFHDDAPEDVEVFFEARSYGKAVVLDVSVNARIGREGHQKNKKSKGEPLTEEYPKVNSGQLFNFANQEEAPI